MSQNKYARNVSVVGDHILFSRHFRINKYRKLRLPIR